VVDVARSVVHVRPFAAVVRVWAPSTLAPVSRACSARATRGASPLGGRRFAAAYVDVGYEQSQGVRSGRELGSGELVDGCRRGGDPELGHRVHGHLQRPFGHYFLVRVERLDQLGYRKPIRWTENV